MEKKSQIVDVDPLVAAAVAEEARSAPRFAARFRSWLEAEGPSWLRSLPSIVLLVNYICFPLVQLPDTWLAAARAWDPSETVSIWWYLGSYSAMGPVCAIVAQPALHLPPTTNMAVAVFLNILIPVLRSASATTCSTSNDHTLTGLPPSPAAFLLDIAIVALFGGTMLQACISPPKLVSGRRLFYEVILLSIFLLQSAKSLYPQRCFPAMTLTFMDFGNFSVLLMHALLGSWLVVLLHQYCPGLRFRRIHVCKHPGKRLSISTCTKPDPGSPLDKTRSSGLHTPLGIEPFACVLAICFHVLILGGLIYKTVFDRASIAEAYQRVSWVFPFWLAFISKSLSGHPSRAWQMLTDLDLADAIGLAIVTPCLVSVSVGGLSCAFDLARAAGYVGRRRNAGAGA